LIYAVDSSGNPIPIRIPAVSVASSDPSVVKIENVSANEFDNSVRVDIYAGKIGTAVMTAAANGFLSSSANLEVVGDAYKPEGLIVKAVPSSFAHYGPYKGYVSVQLVNFFGNPVPADQDMVINLSSSDSSVVPLGMQVVIKQGENFAFEEFEVVGSGITLLQAEVPGKWKESVKITVSQPPAPLQLKFYAAPQIAPARQGQFIYAFVQLQDANGVPLKAEQDIPVNIFSDSSDIRTGSGVIKKGTTTAVITLTINTNNPCSASGIDRAPNNDNFAPCIELVAVAKGFKSQSALIELRTPLTRVDLNPETRFDDPSYVKIDPVIFPSFIDINTEQENLESAVNMPILSDGSKQFIGVVQLMRFVDDDEDGMIDLNGTLPVIPFSDVPPIIESADSYMMEVKNTLIEKGRSSALIEASVGFQAGSNEIAAVAEFFGQTFTQYNLYGHSGIAIAAEPLISRTMARSDFPYVVYFVDAEGRSAYSIGDMTLSIAKIDEPEAEIGISRTTTEILEIEPAKMEKGSSVSLLKATSKGKGSSTITVEGSVKDMMFSTTNTVSMNTQLPEKLELFIPQLILGNAKYSVPLQVLDRNGFPIKTVTDAEISFVPSVRNVLSAPDRIVIPKGEYYTTLLIEAQSDGSTEITALANNFQSTKINVQVTTPEPLLSLTSSVETVRLDEEFKVKLSSQYMDRPLESLKVKWSSDRAMLVEGHDLTDQAGSAEATFLLGESTPLLITAEVSAPGYRTSAVTLNLEPEKIVAEPEEIFIGTSPEPESNKSMGDIVLGNLHLLILPVIGGVVFWLAKTERIVIPFDRLTERFREPEE
jgi:hypothetical protein